MADLLPSTSITVHLPDAYQQMQGSTAEYAQLGLHGADNTQRAYRSDLKQLAAWLTLHHSGQPLVPLPYALLADYIAFMADEGRQVSTITRLLAAVQKAHDLAGMDSPTKEKALAAVLEGIKRHVGTDQKQAPAFSIVQLKQAIAALDLTTPRGLRDRALLLLGFSGAFRRSELRGLNLESFSFRDGALIVKMTGSKTSQHQETEEKAFFYSPSPLYCPIRALEAWRECLPRTTGPLFVSMVGGSRHSEGKPSEQRLSAHSINAIVKLHLGEDFSAHSMRASFVTVAVKSGQNWKTIKNQTKHKTNTMIERYTRLDDIVKDNAAQHLGL